MAPLRSSVWSRILASRRQLAVSVLSSATIACSRGSASASRCCSISMTAADSSACCFRRRSSRPARSKAAKAWSNAPDCLWRSAARRANLARWRAPQSITDISHADRDRPSVKATADRTSPATPFQQPTDPLLQQARRGPSWPAPLIRIQTTIPTTTPCRGGGLARHRRPLTV